MGCLDQPPFLRHHTGELYLRKSPGVLYLTRRCMTEMYFLHLSYAIDLRRGKSEGSRPEMNGEVELFDVVR